MKERNIRGLFDSELLKLLAIQASIGWEGLVLSSWIDTFRVGMPFVL